MECVCLRAVVQKILSEVIASDMYHARIDWYQIDGRMYFGEVTFYDGSGFERFDKEEDEIYLGNLISLPADKA